MKLKLLLSLLSLSSVAHADYFDWMVATDIAQNGDDRTLCFEFGPYGVENQGNPVDESYCANIPMPVTYTVALGNEDMNTYCYRLNKYGRIDNNGLPVDFSFCNMPIVPSPLPSAQPVYVPPRPVYVPQPRVVETYRYAPPQPIYAPARPVYGPGAVARPPQYNHGGHHGNYPGNYYGRHHGGHR